MTSFSLCLMMAIMPLQKAETRRHSFTSSFAVQFKLGIIMLNEQSSPFSNVALRPQRP